MGFVGSLEAEIEAVARAIVDSAFKVHSKYGPGLLEGIYEECLAMELAKRGHEVLRQKRVPLFYDGVELSTPLRLDLLIDDAVVVEVKAVDKLIPIHRAQCLTYLKLTGKRLCLMINFNVELIRDGIERIIH
ncbi:GxxExxY protein [Humisphaera borealis]|uniref:GxxExxY protein n=2 Tax=Humisphaera borealis TaxID=2807512 RepID=A0A7M2X3N9_9BACT|nr:GxxExxY protein [Humisphaera borealis]